MELRLEEYLGRRRDTVRERELAQRLRELPEPERFKYIQTILKSNMAVGLQLANSCLRDKNYFLALLQQGLKQADASSIRWWLETVMPHLGFKRVINVLNQSLQEKPEAVDMAMYWLPGMLPKDNVNAWNNYYKLRDDVREHKKQRKHTPTTKHDPRVDHLRLAQSNEFNTIVKNGTIHRHGGVGLFVPDTDKSIQGEAPTHKNGFAPAKQSEQELHFEEAPADEVLI